MRIVIVMILASSLLSACAVSDFFSKTWEILKDSSVPVGEAKDRPSTLSLSMNASKNVNPNPFNDKISDLDNVIIENSVDASPDLSRSRASLPAASFHSMETANANANKASPIVFKLIQLKDNALMLQADFDGLFDDTEQVLDTSYLTHEDYILTPNEFKYVRSFPVEKDTRYIGVVAGYHDYSNAVWKRIVKINPMGEDIVLFINFNEYAVEVKTEENLQ